MIDETPPSALATIGRWALVLGLTGFVFGFVGPMLFAPDSNQGPMLGLFITGPAGALGGAIFGAVVGANGVRRLVANYLLTGAVLLLAATTLYFSMPEPRYYADAVEGEIVGCTAVVDLRDTTVERLTALSAARPALPHQVGWDDAFDKALDQDHGVVLDVHLARYRRLYRREARWNRGTLEAGPWAASDANVPYYALHGGSDCDSYAIGADTQFSVISRIGIWPPAAIAEMLNVAVAVPLEPDEVAVVGAIPTR